MFGFRQVGRCSLSPSIRQIQPRSSLLFSTASGNDPKDPAAGAGSPPSEKNDNLLSPIESRSLGRGKRIKQLKEESTTMKLFTESITSPRPLKSEQPQPQPQPPKKDSHSSASTQRTLLFQELEKLASQPEIVTKSLGRGKDIPSPNKIELKSLLDNPGPQQPAPISSKSFFDAKKKSLQPKKDIGKVKPDRLLGEDKQPAPRLPPTSARVPSTAARAPINAMDRPPSSYSKFNNQNTFNQKGNLRRKSAQPREEFRRKTSSSSEMRESRFGGSSSIFYTDTPVDHQEELTLEKYLSGDLIHPFTLGDYYSKKERLGYEMFRLPDDDKYEQPTEDEVAYYGHGRIFPVGDAAYDGIDWNNFDRIPRISNEKYFVNISPLHEVPKVKFKTPEDFIASIPKTHAHYKSIMDTYKIADRSPWYNNNQKLNMLIEVSQEGLRPS